MSEFKKRNAGHSAFERLRNQALDNGEDLNRVLNRYAMERLLYRLSISPIAADFVLKGALMFYVWKRQHFRLTRDADFLKVKGLNSPRHIAAQFADLCRIPASDDGVELLPDSVRATPIRKDRPYQGVRVTLDARIHRAKVHLQVDIGFGDAITPRISRRTFPVLLEFPEPRILVYTTYSMAAEKLEAMVRLGMANSRMKDFYDVWLLSCLFKFNGMILIQALRRTFKQRSAVIPEKRPIVFTEEFYSDPQKQMQWRAFVNKAKPRSSPESLKHALLRIEAFLWPVLKMARTNAEWTMQWIPSNEWRPQK